MKSKTKKPVEKKLIYPRNTTQEMVQNAIYTTQAFHFVPDMALTLINKGMLGFETDGQGRIKTDNQGKKIPITISRASFYRYREIFNDLPDFYKYLSNFAMKGYAKLLVGYQEELAVLHRMSVENLFAVKDPLERQQIIDSIVKNVITTESAFADMLKHKMEKEGLMQATKKESDDEPKNDTQ